MIRAIQEPQINWRFPYNTLRSSVYGQFAPLQLLNTMVKTRIYNGIRRTVFPKKRTFKQLRGW